LRPEATTRASSHTRNVALSWGVHLYTALGLVCALLATLAAYEGSARMMFLYLVLAFAVDSSDGTLARKVRVWEWTPDFDGRKLDDITDFLNYTFIPVFFIYRFGLLPPVWWPVLAVVVVASAYGFCSAGAKTDDGYFTGFPSYWNVVAFYLYLLKLSAPVAAAVCLFFAVMTFVPIKYLYPSKTPVFKKLNIGYGVLWAILCFFIVVADFDDPSPLLVWLSLTYPAYYMGLSAYLHFRPVAPHP
jgi:phosphatidylcholine synthase